MSDVDKRVVQMDFDNKKFEKNVKQSTESLNTLKSSLNFDGVSNSIDQVTVKFSKMEMVVASVISNITNRIVNLGIQIVKSLSVDNIAAGWEKFGQKTTSVATLMAQTLKVNGKILEDAEKLTTVNELMDKLMWFTDETSYSFTDMIDNIGKFTAAGLDLDVSTKAMEGIANWAALSGQNASTASRAMYQLSQAMGKGKIQLIDWKSIQNANMDTAEMRENVLKTAVAMGQLTKEGDKYVTKTGKKFTQNQFTEELSEGWFTSDVLTATLEKYSGATDEIYALAQKEGKTASEILEKYGDTLNAFGVKAFKAAQEARTLSDALNSVKDAVASKWMTTSELIFGDKDEAVELWTDLANALYEVFAESGDFRNSILEVWNSLPGREDLFKRGGDDQGAFWNIFDAIIAVKNVIKQAWNTIFPLSQMEEDSDKAQEIGNTIKQLTSRFKEWTKTLKLSDVNALRLRKILEGLFTILKGVLTVLKAIKFIAEPIIDVIKKMAAAGIDALISLMGKFNISGEWLVIVSNKIHDGLEHMFEAVSDFVKEYVSIDKIKNAFAKLGAVFANLAPVLEKVKSSFIDFGNKIKSVVANVVNAIKRLFGIADGKTIDNRIIKPMKKSLSDFSDVASDITKTSEVSEGKSQGLLSGLIELFEALYNVLVSLLSITTATVALLAKMLKVAATIIQSLADGIKAIAEANFKLEDWQKNLLITTGIIGGIAIVIALIIKMVYNMFYTISAMISPLGVVADSLSGYFDKLAAKTLSDAIKNFATAVLEISIALLIIASINPERLWSAVIVMGIISAILLVLVGIIGIILKKTETISKATTAVGKKTRTIKQSIAGCFDEVKGLISETKKLMKINTIVRTIQAFGAAMLEIAIAMYIIGKLDGDQILAGLGVIAAVTVMIGILSLFAKTSQQSVKDILPSIGQMITIAVVISSLGKALLKFKDLNEEQRISILVAGAVLAAFFLFLLSFMAAIDKINSKGNIKENNKTLKSVKKLITSLLVLSISLKILGSQSWETNGKALVIMAGVLGLFLAFAIALGKVKGALNAAVKSAKALRDFAISVAIISASIALLAFQPWGRMLTAASSIAIVILSFAAMAAILGKVKGALNAAVKSAKALRDFAISVAIISASIALLAFQPWGRMLTAASSIAIVILSFAAMAAILGKVKGALNAAVKSAKAFLKFSISVVLIGSSLALMANQPWDQMLAAAGALSLVLLSLSASIGLLEVFGVGAGEFLKKMTAMSLGLIMLSVAMIAFGIAMKTFQSIDIRTIGRSLLVMVAGIAALAIAAACTSKITPAIIGLAAAFLMIGLGMLLAATAIQMVITTLTTLSTMSEEQLATVSTAMNTFMSILGNSFGPLITGLINSLREGLSALMSLANEVVLGIVNLLETQLPALASLVITIVAKIAKDLADNSKDIYESIATLISNLLTMLKDNAAKWAQDVMDIVISLLGVLSKKENVNKVVKEILTFFKNLIDALVNSKDLLNDIFNGVMSFVNFIILRLANDAIELAGMLGKVLLIVTAAAIRILIAALGTLSKLFLTLVASVLLILAYTFTGLGAVLLEVLKVIVKETLRVLVEAIIWAQNIFLAVGQLIMQLIARGLLGIIELGFGWLFDVIDEIFGTSIRDDLHQLQDDLANSARATVNSMEASTDRVQAAIKNASNNITDVVEMTSTQANEAVVDGLSQITNAVTDASDQLKSSGIDLGNAVGDGYVTAVDNNTEKANEATYEMTKSSVDSAADGQESHSPSKKFAKLGLWAVLGYAQGVSDNTYVATDGMTTMVSEALTAAQNTLDSQNGDDLTIKVGMDISGVEEQSRNISSIMSSINNVNATAYGKNASYNSAAMNKGASVGTVNSTDNSTTVTYNNVINVSSTDPERSADEIDRALQRQATMAKLAHGAV